jgi:hypothetical protein
LCQGRNERGNRQAHWAGGLHTQSIEQHNLDVDLRRSGHAFKVDWQFLAQQDAANVSVRHFGRRHNLLHERHHTLGSFQKRLHYCGRLNPIKKKVLPHRQRWRSQPREVNTIVPGGLVTTKKLDSSPV